MQLTQLLHGILRTNVADAFRLMFRVDDVALSRVTGEDKSLLDDLMQNGAPSFFPRPPFRHLYRRASLLESLSLQLLDTNRCRRFGAHDKTVNYFFLLFYNFFTIAVLG